MKSRMATAVGAAALMASGLASAQQGGMMDGGGMGYGWMGGYGGIWLPVFVVAVVAGLVVWVVMQKRK